MKAFTIPTILMLIVFFNNANAQLTCKKGGVSLGYVHHIPEDGELITTGAFTMDVFFLKRYHKNFNTSFGLELNTGARRFNKVIENITFEGDYEGFADYSFSRTEVWGKFMVGTQIKNIVEFTVPIRIGYRSQGYREYFDLYEGQEIKEEDLATEEETEEDSDNRFSKTNHFGIGAGLNLAFLPSSNISPFVEVSYSYFGSQDHQNIENASLNNGIINIPSYTAPNSSSYNVRVGVRFNIGSCPKKTGNIYEDSKTSKRVSPNPKHSSVSRKIVDKSVNTQPNNSETNSDSSKGDSTTKPKVVLKPKVPTKPTPTWKK
jgi:hypothetical protein